MKSFASSYGLGKIAYIMHALNCTATEARIRARITGSENGVWHEKNGYGEINVNSAIAYNGEVKLGIGNINVERTSGFSVKVTIEKVAEATDYKIFRDGEVISTQKELVFEDTIPNYGEYLYKYEALNGSLTSNSSNITKLKYNAGRWLKI